MVFECPPENFTPPTETEKPILFIHNAKNITGNEHNYCYNRLNLTKVRCLEEKYTAIVILDGEYFKQRNSHPPKFYVTDDTQLPVVSISYLDQLKHQQLVSAGGIEGSIAINSVQTILDKTDKLFNLTCDLNRCHRFEVLCFEKASIS